MSNGKWTDALKINIGIVDDQHQALFELIETLGERARNKDFSGVDEALETLVANTVTHFQTEEDLFVEYDYPDAENHIRVHKALLKDVSAMIDLYHEDNEFEFFDLIDFLNAWMVQHTSGLDLEFATYFLEMSKRVNSRELRIIELKEEVNRLSKMVGESIPYPRSNQAVSLPKMTELSDSDPKDMDNGSQKKTLFNELESFESLKLMFKHFCEAIGVAAAIIDTEGEIIIQSKWQRVCTDFHRVHEKTCANCIDSDTILANALKEGKSYTYYTCKNGLTDCASPIIINGLHLANVFIGQFHLTPPDRGFFEHQADQYGFDKIPYMQAVEEAPLIEQRKFEHLIGFLVNFTTIITQLLKEKVMVESLTTELKKKLDTLAIQEKVAKSLLEDSEKSKAAMEKNQALALEQAKLISAHAAVAEAESRLRGILTAVPDSVLAINKNRVVEAANKGLHEFLNLADGSMVGLTVDELCQKIKNAPKAMLIHQMISGLTANGVGQSHHAYDFLDEAGETVYMEYVINAIWHEEQLNGFVFVLRNVTEHVESDALLRQKEQQMRILIDNIPAVILMKDLEGRYTLANAYYMNATGWQPEEVVGLTDYDIFPKEIAERIVSLDRLTMDSGMSQRFEEKIQNPDGELRIYKTVNIPLFDQDEKVYGMCGISMDMTEDIKKSEMIEHERTAFENILNASPVGVGVVVDGVVAFANNAMKAIAGTEVGELIAPRYEDLEVREQILMSLKSDGFVKNKEVAFRDLNNETRETLATFMPTTYNNKNGILAWLVDITERKQMENELHEAQNQLSVALEAANMGSWKYNPVDKKIIADDKMAQLYGLDVSLKEDEKSLWNRYQGQWNTYVDSEDLKKVSEIMRETWRNQQSHYQSQFRIVKPGEPVRYLMSFGKFSYDEAGKPLQGTGIVWDVTELKEAELTLEKAKLLAEEATRSKSEFLANMSHEIRTPMNAVIGLNHLLLKTELTAKQRDYAHKIGNSAQSLLGIINDILDFSKIEAGKLSVESTNFELDSVLDNLSNMIGLKTMEKGIELVFDIGVDVPMMLNGDPLRLGQVLLNLANNAVKFTEQGEIKISASLIDRVKNRATLYFSVSDTGIGMNEEQKGKLFQAFSQADTSTSRKFGGTGLGLTISKKLCELMGGEIDFTSEAGVGSTFFFTVNVGIQDNDKKKSNVIPRILKSLKTLVVDDNESARLVLVNYLTDFAFEVDAVASGEAAIELVRNQMQVGEPYKLILMDWKMEGMNGIQTTRRILEMTQHIESPKVIMVTGYGREEIMEEAKEAHINSFLIKPVNQSLLFDTIIDVFNVHAETPGIQGTPHHSEATLSLETIRGAKILLVEDNLINQQVAVELLESEGFEVIVANHGKEGVDLYNNSKESPFDIILMDLQMPVMDGITASKIILADPAGCTTPIVAMTADAMAGVQQQVLEAGLNGYVTKPIDLGDLFTTLLKWIKPRDNSGKTFAKKSSAETDIVIPEVPGIDQAEGLKRIGGNKTVYLKLLNSFYKANESFEDQLEELLSAMDLNTAIRYVHSLKGVSGNIGAKEVFTSAAEVERILKGIDLSDGKTSFTPPAQRYDLYRVLSRLLSELKTLVLDQMVSEEVHIVKDEAKISEAKAALINALESYDAVAMDHLEVLRNAGAFIQQEALFETLKGFIEQYDFEGALEHLNQ